MEFRQRCCVYFLCKYFQPVFLLALCLNAMVLATGSVKTELSFFREVDIDVEYTITDESNSTTNETVSLFERRPPLFSVHDAGESAMYECVPANWTTDFTVSWKTPANVQVMFLNSSMVPFDDNNVTSDASALAYVSENKTLLTFINLDKRYAGKYSCILENGTGHVVTEAPLRLHVIDIRNINYVKKLLFGLLAATLATVLILALNFLITRNEKNDRKNKQIEMDSVEEKQEPML